MQGNGQDERNYDVLYNAHIEELINYDWKKMRADIEELINGAEKDSNDKPKYYDWTKMLSYDAYDADVTIVVGARGVGKAYEQKRRERL